MLSLSNRKGNAGKIKLTIRKYNTREGKQNNGSLSNYVINRYCNPTMKNEDLYYLHPERTFYF